MAGILLNYIETELTSDQMEIFKLADVNSTIRSLRERYGNKYNFYFNKGEIFFWTKNEEIVNELPGTSACIKTNESPQVYSKVVETAIIDFFYNLKNPDGTKIYRVKKNDYYA